MADIQCDADDSDAERSRAEQKIILLERMAKDSMPALRVVEAGTQEAKTLLEKSRYEVIDARSAFDLGCYAKASTLAAAGLMTASAAFRSNSKSNAVDANEYKDLRRRVSSLIETAEKQDAELLAVSAEEVADMRRQIARAEQLATQGEHTQAIPLIAPIADRLERRLMDMFDKKTLFYSKEFASAAEEHGYLVEHYRGCRLLLDSRAMHEAQTLAAALIAAEKSVIDAERAASSGKWDDAVRAMQHAIEQCEQATRFAGIYK